MMGPLPLPDHAQLRRIAKGRETLHASHTSSRPLSNDYEYVSMVGEYEFALTFAARMDLTQRSRGDGGKDFTIVGLTIDIKTARIPKYLPVEQGKVRADIYVMAAYNDVSDTATLLRWEWGIIVRTWPIGDLGHGIKSHHKMTEECRPIEWLGVLLRMRGWKYDWSNRI